MISKIINICNTIGADAYRINETTTHSAELFFVKQCLDMKRAKNVHEYAITVYNDAVTDGKKLRGTSSVCVSPFISDADLTQRIGAAYASAGLARAPYYELHAGEQADLTNTADSPSLADAVLKMTEALYAEDKGEAFINSAEIYAVKKTDRIVTSTGTDVSFDSFEFHGEFVTQCKQPIDVEQHVSFSYSKPDAEALRALAKSALSSVQDRANAVALSTGGSYPLILSEKHVAALMEFYTERASASPIYSGYSSYAIGDDVQGATDGEKLNITLKATKPYSREGVPMRDCKLLEGGILRAITGDVRFCSYLGVPPTGDYECVVLENGTKTLEQLKAKPYLHVVTFSDFQMDALSGYFGGEIRLAYLFDGKTVSTVTGGSVSGNLLQLQKNLVFSTERYTSGKYEGPYAVLLEGVSIAG